MNLQEELSRDGDLEGRVSVVRPNPKGMRRNSGP
jgi:hypothetical protein